MKWKKGCWFSLCLSCFAKYHKQGGYCDVDQRDKFKCSLCGKEAVAEFYPALKKRRATSEG